MPTFTSKRQKSPASEHAESSGPRNADVFVRRRAFASEPASNHERQRLLADRPVQRKLTVNRPGDKFEREADRVSEAVVAMSGNDVWAEHQVDDARPVSVQRMCSRCRRRYRQGRPLNCSDCKEELHRKATSPRTSGEDRDLEQQIASVRRGGRRLSASARSFFEPRFGRDFSDVRVHTGSRADAAAQSVNAEAFTVGRDIAFRSGAYRPGTDAGKQLLAHELTHVVQQRRETSTSIRRRSAPDGDGAAVNEGLAPSEWPQVRFEHNSTSFTDWAGVDPEAQLAEMVNFARRYLQANPDGRLVLFGYASEEGGSDYNRKLSKRRADRVKEYLVAHGIPDDRITTKARGEDQTYPGLQANRRVQLHTSPILLEETVIRGMTPEEKELRRCGVEVIGTLARWHNTSGGTGDTLFQAAESRASVTAAGAAYFEVDPKWGPGVQVQKDFCKIYPESGMCQERAAEKRRKKKEYETVFAAEFWKEYKNVVLETLNHPDEGCFHLIFQETDLFTSETQDHPVLREVERKVRDWYADYQVRSALAKYLVELANADQPEGIFFYVPPAMTFSEAKDVVDRLVGPQTNYAEGIKRIDQWYQKHGPSSE